MKKTVGLLSFLLVLGVGTHAFALNLTPEDMIPGTDEMGPSNCEAGCVYETFGLVDDGSLQLLYKADVGGGDSGTYAGDYTTVFNNTPTDPSDALISWNGVDAIICEACYLAVKDGNQDPAYYFYNLSLWDGMENLNLTGFWPNAGAISHVSIWGIEGDGPGGTPTPEPGTMFLMGSGLAGLGFWRWKKGTKTEA